MCCHPTDGPKVGVFFTSFNSVSFLQWILILYTSVLQTIINTVFSLSSNYCLPLDCFNLSTGSKYVINVVSKPDASDIITEACLCVANLFLIFIWLENGIEMRWSYQNASIFTIIFSEKNGNKYSLLIEIVVFSLFINVKSFFWSFSCWCMFDAAINCIVRAGNSY